MLATKDNLGACMTEIIKLASFKQKKKQQFLEKHKTILDKYIRSFISAHTSLSYEMFREHYLNQMHYQNDLAWDYLDFRDVLTEAMSEALGEKLWLDAKSQPWFKSQFLSKDELVDRLTSLFIIGAAVSGID